MSATAAPCWKAADAAIGAAAGAAFSFPERLIAEPSTVGQETGVRVAVGELLQREAEI